MDKTEQMLELEKMAIRCAKSIAVDKVELKKRKEMHDAAIMEDAEYAELCLEIKRLQELRKKAKARVSQQPHIKKYKADMKEVRSRIKENKKALSDYLGEFSRQSGLDFVTDSEGVQWKIAKNMTIAPSG